MKKRLAVEHARRMTLLDSSPVVHDAAAVRAAIARLAIRIDLELHVANPVVAVVLQGGLYFAGQLLPCLRFPLNQATVQVSRYGNAESGAALRWLSPLSMDVSGRVVLVVDDVFDEGITLDLLCRHIQDAGAARVLSAVLVRKDVPRTVERQPDFVGLECGPEFLFGCGMDYRGSWRNLAEIRAIPADVVEQGVEGAEVVD